MTVELAPIAGKLSKLLRLLLSSDRGGEIVAASKAIGRALESIHLDHHDFAEAIEAATHKRFSEEDAKEIYRRGVAKGRQDEQNARPATFHNVGSPPWAEIAEECATRRHLRPNEVEFVEDMERLCKCGGEPTEKQARWLRSIYSRRPKV